MNFFNILFSGGDVTRMRLTAFDGTMAYSITVL